MTAARRFVRADFHGAAAADDTLVAVVKQFAGWLSAELIPAMYAERVSLREVVRSILASIPSERYLETLDVVRSELEGDTRLLSEVRAMERHPCGDAVALGNSVTDRRMALRADVVFARNRRAGYLDERGAPDHGWESFTDVRAEPARRWQPAARCGER